MKNKVINIECFGVDFQHGNKEKSLVRLLKGMLDTSKNIKTIIFTEKEAQKQFDISNSSDFTKAIVHLTNTWQNTLKVMVVKKDSIKKGEE